MASQHKKTHPYHLVPMSPWPILTAFSLFFIVIGTLLTLNPPKDLAGFGPPILIVAVTSLLISLFSWFRDIIREANKDHNPTVRGGFRWGMVLFILSEVMFFVAFFWAFFNAALDPNAGTGGVWPPKGIHPIAPWNLPYFNTLLLLLSGTTVTWAHEEMIEGNVKGMKKMTLYTILIGLVFLGVQAYEYGHATFAFKGGIYPSTFYMATGFHGFHVFLGLILLGVCWFRAKAGHFQKGDHFGFDASVWYWHFVDVVWLFLFISIYWWGSGEGV